MASLRKSVKSKQSDITPDSLATPITTTADSLPMSKSDKSSIVLLIILYALQGVPLGLVMGSIPFLLQASLKKMQDVATYTALGYFSITSYPYSLKLLWSPFVDTYYHAGFGKRKSWIIPAQFLIAVTMFMSSYFVEEWIEKANVTALTTCFVVLVFMVATQDIAVDAWALTMLSKDNQAYASTSQTIGLNIGFFLSYSIFLGLSSSEFCNAWIRFYLDYPTSSEGIVSVSSYLAFWAIVYLFVTTSLFWKSESLEVAKVHVDVTLEEESTLLPPSSLPIDHLARDTDTNSSGLLHVYKQIYIVLKMPIMRGLIFYLLTSRIGFAANDNVTVLKLTEKGLPKEHLGLLALISFPLEMVAPLFVARWVKSSTSLTPLIFAYPLRLVFCVLAAAMIYWLPADGKLPTSAYVIIIASQLSYELLQNCMFVSICAFFVKIADPKIGGTYMTMLNTLANLGGVWVKSLSLASVDWLSFNYNSCDALNTCVDTKIDGYYILTAISFVCGSIYFWFMAPKLREMDVTAPEAWHHHEISDTKTAVNEK